jgi:tRNA 2-thiouridine synthesizing protein E
MVCDTGLGASKPVTDSEGYLLDPDDWTAEWARDTASDLGIVLGEDHWAVIRFMREYYGERRIAADARFVIRLLDERAAGGGRKRLFELFPYGYVAQACKVAGMMRPRAWSTG